MSEMRLGWCLAVLYVQEVLTGPASSALRVDTSGCAWQEAAYRAGSAANPLEPGKTVLPRWSWKVTGVP